MKTEIRQRFSIGGHRFTLDIVSVELDRLHNDPVMKAIIRDMVEANKLDSDIITKNRYQVRCALNRGFVVAHVMAMDELGAVALIMRDIRQRVMAKLGYARYDRSK